MGISQIPVPTTSSGGNRSWVSLATVTPVFNTSTTSITSLAAYPFYRITLEDVVVNTAQSIWLRLNNDATSKYMYVTDQTNAINGSRFTYWEIGTTANTTHTQFYQIDNTSTLCVMEGFSYSSSNLPGANNNAKGYWWGAAQINRIDLVLNATVFTGSGTIRVWGSN